MILRRVARPLLASIFITGGLDALRNPAPQVDLADDVAPQVTARLPGMDEQDTESIMRINGGVQVAAGALLAMGRFPRLSAAVLAASVIPTTAAGHRFWEYDGAQRKQQQTHFLKNLGLLGGLLVAAVDTEGRPGLAWRTRHGAEHTGAAVRRGRKDAKRAAKTARREAKLAAKAARSVVSA